MRHFLFLCVLKSANTDASGWEYLLSMLIVILLSLLFWAFRRIRRQQKLISAYRHRSGDQLRFIRGLLDLCYSYSESPAVFIDKFKDKVNIRELKYYDLIDTTDSRFSDLKENEKLLCMLWEYGFSPRELSVIFNLKKVSNLYTKYHRIQVKLESKKSKS